MVVDLFEERRLIFSVQKGEICRAELWLVTTRQAITWSGKVPDETEGYRTQRGLSGRDRCSFP